MGEKKNTKKYTNKNANAKHCQRPKYHNFGNEFIKSIRHAFSNGLVQNITIVFIGVLVALIISMVTSTGIKAAALTFAIIGTIAIWIFAVAIIRYYPSETEFSGLLSPGREPTPQNPCGDIPNDAMLILLGKSASYGTSFPQTIIKIGQDRMLTIDKINNRIAVNAKLFSRDGRIVAEIKNSKFFINPNNYFRKERSDAHSLIVFVQEGIEILNIRYINERTIKFLGVIRHPRTTVVISDIHGFFANTVCSGEAGDAHFAFTIPPI